MVWENSRCITPRSAHAGTIAAAKGRDANETNMHHVLVASARLCNATAKHHGCGSFLADLAETSEAAWKGRGPSGRLVLPASTEQTCFGEAQRSRRKRCCLKQTLRMRCSSETRVMYSPQYIHGAS